MTKVAAIGLGIVVSFALGCVVGWYVQLGRSTREQASISVVHEVEVAGLCVGALQTAEQGKAAKLQNILETRMTSAVDFAAARVADAAPVGFPVPDLVESARRVRAYAAAKPMPSVVAKCDRLIEFLAARTHARA